MIKSRVFVISVNVSRKFRSKLIMWTYSKEIYSTLRHIQRKFIRRKVLNWVLFKHLFSTHPGNDRLLIINQCCQDSQVNHLVFRVPSFHVSQKAQHTDVYKKTIEIPQRANIFKSNWVLNVHIAP